MLRGVEGPRDSESLRSSTIGGNFSLLPFALCFDLTVQIGEPDLNGSARARNCRKMQSAQIVASPQSDWVHVG